MTASLAMDFGDRQIEQFRAQVLRLYLVIGAVAAIPLLFVYHAIGNQALMVVTAIFGAIVVSAALVFFSGRASLDRTAQIFVATTICAILAGVFFGNEINDNKPWQLLIPIAALTLCGSRAGAAWTVGALVIGAGLYASRSEAYDTMSVVVLLTAYATASVALYLFSVRNERNLRTIARLSHTDSLTGTYNRQLFDELASNAVNRARRGDEALAVLMIDIDHFKPFNDRYGHVAGDEALVDVAGVIRQSARRASDLVFRYGGEEFCVITAGQEADDAEKLARTILQGVEALGIAHKDSAEGVLTVSVGVAHYEYLDELNAEGVLRRADEALYKAKTGGRNQVVVSTNDRVVAADFSTAGDDSSV